MTVLLGTIDEIRTKQAAWMKAGTHRVHAESQAGSQKQVSFGALCNRYIDTEDDLPLDHDLATVLLNWKQHCPESEEDWVFPSKITGRCYHASPIQQDDIRSARMAYLSAHLPLVAGFGRHFDRCAAETHAACSGRNHHERVRKRHDGDQPRSQ